MYFKCITFFKVYSFIVYSSFIPLCNAKEDIYIFSYSGSLLHCCLDTNFFCACRLGTTWKWNDNGWYNFLFWCSVNFPLKKVILRVSNTQYAKTLYEEWYLSVILEFCLCVNVPQKKCNPLFKFINPRSILNRVCKYYL